MQRLMIPEPKQHHSKLHPLPRRLRERLSKSSLAFVLVLAPLFATPAHGASCSASSSGHRVALLELYTSQGCNSCPPAERWLGGLQDRGTGTNKVVPLAFHVDYWDYIGWKDKFAQPGFSQRQRLVATRNQSSFIYTPQFVLNGKDFRRPWKKGRLADKLGPINANLSKVRIELQQVRKANEVHVTVRADNSGRQRAHLFVALYQNGLQTQVKAGENAGKKLYHEFVVRELAGPVPVASGKTVGQEISFDLSPYQDLTSIGLAVFAEDAASGETQQAMAIPLCGERADSESPAEPTIARLNG